MGQGQEAAGQPGRPPSSATSPPTGLMALPGHRPRSAEEATLGNPALPCPRAGPMWGLAHRPAEPDGVQNPDGHHAGRDGHHEVDQREPVDLLRGEEEVLGDRVSHGREAEPQLRDTPGVSPGRGLRARPPPPSWAQPAGVRKRNCPAVPRWPGLRPTPLTDAAGPGARCPPGRGPASSSQARSRGPMEASSPARLSLRDEARAVGTGDLCAACWGAGGMRWHWQGRGSLSELVAPASSRMDGPGRGARLQTQRLWWTPRWTRARGQLAESHEGTVGVT